MRNIRGWLNTDYGRIERHKLSRYYVDKYELNTDYGRIESSKARITLQAFPLVKHGLW